jgi:Lysozyme like domain
MFVALKESGCRPDAVSKPNRNGTIDYGLFQINGENLTLEDNVRRAKEKYDAGRVGVSNWSAWFSVCTPGNNPQPKYPNVIKKCK